MNLRNLFKSALCAGAVVAATASISFAQTEQKVEPSYDVLLQLVVGSNDTSARPDLPGDLARVAKSLHARYPYSNYKVTGIFQGRVADAGSYNYRSAANLLGQESTTMPQTFLEWSVGDIRGRPTAKGQPGFDAKVFRFGARIPVPVNSHDESGRTTPGFSYENIGIDSQRLGLAENVPTLIGTLNLPGTSGTIFLVMTVRAAEL